VAGWGEDGALEAIRDYAATIDAVARRIEAAVHADGGSADGDSQIAAEPS